MLIKKLNKQTVVCIKLQNGTEVIGEYIGAEGMAYQIKNPLQIFVDDQNRIVTTFYMVGIEKDKPVEIYSNHVVTISEPPSDLTTQYRNMIGETK